MATTKSYTQDIQSQAAVRIGSARIFTAALGVTFPQTRFDTSAPPTGWVDLGATGEDTTLEVNRTTYDLMTGVLKTLKAQFVIGMEAKISGTLLEYDKAALDAAIGAADPVVITGMDVKIAVGTSVVRKSQVAVVHDFITGDGTTPQFIYYMPKAATIKGAFHPSVGNDKETVRIPIEFHGYGVPDPAWDDIVLVVVYSFVT